MTQNVVFDQPGRGAMPTENLHALKAFLEERRREASGLSPFDPAKAFAYKDRARRCLEAIKKNVPRDTDFYKGLYREPREKMRSGAFEPLTAPLTFTNGLVALLAKKLGDEQTEKDIVSAVNEHCMDGGRYRAFKSAPVSFDIGANSVMGMLRANWNIERAREVVKGGVGVSVPSRLIESHTLVADLAAALLYLQSNGDYGEVLALYAPIRNSVRAGDGLYPRFGGATDEQRGSVTATALMGCAIRSITGNTAELEIIVKQIDALKHVNGLYADTDEQEGSAGCTAAVGLFYAYLGGL